jgi:hypothetical protein
MINEKWLSYVCLFIGLSFPFVIVKELAYFHEPDIWTFISWSDYWAYSVRDIYLNCKTCNYPILGLLVTGGLITLLKEFNTNSDQDIYQYFRYFLAVGDAVIFLLNFTLIRLLNVPYAIFIALFIALFPSSWAGSSAWGQIDGIVQIWILLSLIGFMLSVRTIHKDVDGRYINKAMTYFSLGGISAVLGIFTKQLFVVSIPTLLSLWILSQYLMLKRYGFKSFTKVIVVNILLLLILVLPDLYFRLPYEFKDHLNYIFLGGGSGNISWTYISWNGVNVWNILGWKQSTPSTKAFWGLLSPLNTGVVLFLIYLSALYVCLVIRIIQGIKKSEVAWHEWREIASLTIFSLGLAYLGFNVILPGTHERYMFHSYPFLIISIFYFWYYNRTLSLRWVAYVSLCAIAYGTFILRLIGLSFPLLFIFQNHYFQVVIHIVLLVLLTDAWFRVCIRSIQIRSPYTNN